MTDRGLVRRISLNGSQLKLLAMIFMTIDHVGAILLPYGTPLYWGFRTLGRLAFPIYCFLLVEGAFHTRSQGKYLMRLGSFALISEIPFDLAQTGQLLEFQHQNVFITLFLAEAMMAGILRIMEFTANGRGADSFTLTRCSGREAGLVFFCLMAAMVLAEICHGDYGASGVLLVFFLMQLRGRRVGMVYAALLTAAMWIGSWCQMAAAVAFGFPLSFYNGEKGPGGFKYLFYIYYPLHLLILAILAGNVG